MLTDRARDGINGVLKGFGWAANPSDVTGFANSDVLPRDHGLPTFRRPTAWATLVVASGAGADAAGGRR